MFELKKWWKKLIRPGHRPTKTSRKFRPALERLEEREVPSVSLQLVVPPATSFGVDDALTVHYANTGAAAAPAPVLVVSAQNADLWLPGDPAVSGPSLQVLATGPTGPAGTLAPGASGTIVVDFTSTSSTASAVNFSLGQLTAGQTINWASVEASMRPSTISSAAWPAVFANFTANVGGNTTTYQAALDGDATYLAQLGEPTNDVARLVAYEINKASDVFSTTTLGDTVDAGLPTPGGLSLNFERWYQPGVSARYQMGSLGLGWTNNWDITASADSAGDVTIDQSGALRDFTLQSNGSYLGNFGDDGVLTKLSGGGYQLTETDGSSTVFNANGSLEYVQDSDGNRITASYNSAGLLSQLTASNGEYLTLTYSAAGLLTKVTDSTGAATTYAYDATGKYLLSAANEFGTTSFTYVAGQGAAAQNALASITFADNSIEYFGYDAEGRLINEHQDNSLENTTIAYGAAGGYTTTDADGHTSSVMMDDNGQVCETIDALGNVTRYSYDISGDLTAVNGPQGANYAYTYDSNGNLTSTTDPLGLTTQFTYNASNDLTSYTDAKGNTTSYGYDSGNNLLSVTYANGASESFSYNPIGEATQFVNANGSAIGSTFNTQGLVAQETFADGSSYSYTYDVHGNMLTATSAAGTITFLYQNVANPDLLTEVEYPNGQYLKFSYNAIGQRTQSVDQTGFTVNYSYDALGRLQKLTGATGALIVQYTYDAAGNLTQQNNGNGTFTVSTYDADGDVLSITNYALSTGGASYVPAKSAVNSFNTYTYDALGNVLTDTNQDGRWAYTYDADCQLTQSVFTPNSSDPDGLASQNLQYAYDAAGNRISQTINGVTTAYDVNNVNEYTSSTTNGATTTYSYDNDGNLISQAAAGSTTIFSYNKLDELTGVSGPDQTATYTYDPLGNRNSQTVNGVATQFQIDPTGLGNLASTYTSGGSLIAHYTYGLALTSQVSAGGSAAYYDFDRTGNTIGITSATGAYVNKYTYLPFGQTTAVKSTLTNPFTYVGEFGVIQDGASLFNTRAREYSPVTGQFLSNDPLGLNGGDTNVRRYSGNSPTVNIDPTGTDWWDPSTWFQQTPKEMPSQGLLPGTTSTGPASQTQTQTGSGYHAIGDPEGGALGPHDDSYRNLTPGSGGARDMTPTDPNDQAGPFGQRTYRAPMRPNLPKTGGNHGLNYQPHNTGGTTNRQVSPQQVRPGPDTTYDPNLNPVLVAMAPTDTMSTPQANGSTTDDNEPVAPSTNVVAGAFVEIFIAYFSDYAPGVTAADFQASASYTDDYVGTLTDTPTCQVVTAPNSGGEPGNFAVAAFTTFAAAGDWAGSVNINGAGLSWTDSNLVVFAQQAPLALQASTVSIPASGVFDGVIATFQNTGPTASQDTYHVSVGTAAQMSVVSASVQPGAGGAYQVVADLNFGDVPQANTALNVIVTSSDPINNTVGNFTWTGNIASNAIFANAGQSPFTTSIDSPVIQASPDPVDLASVVTTAAGALALNQVSATSSNPNVIVTGDTITPLPGGGNQINIQGIVNAASPGAGPAIAPLTINIAGQPSLADQLEYVSTNSLYAVNAMPVTAVAGQALRNVQVATVVGPIAGPYSGTVAWGDGETSPAQFTALGGNLFSVTATKPQAFAASGSYTMTVTVNGPGNTPAPAAQGVATVSEPAPAPTDFVVADFLGSGISLYSDGAWTSLHTNDANSVAVDVNGDVVAAFGSNGVSLYKGGKWTVISKAPASQVDIAGNGIIVAEFPGFGVYRYENGAWQLLSKSAATSVAVDANGDVVGAFGSLGVYRYEGTAWTKIAAAPATQVAIAGNGIVAAEFAGLGLYEYQGTTWTHLSSSNATSIGVDAEGDVIGAFGSAGVYLYEGGATTQLATTTASIVGIAAGATVAAEFPGAGVFLAPFTNSALTTTNASLLGIGA
jgi:RHS repeat-associated protein